VSLYSLFLNWLIVGKFTTASGKLFHVFTFREIIFSYIIPHTLLVVYTDDLWYILLSLVLILVPFPHRYHHIR